MYDSLMASEISISRSVSSLEWMSDEDLGLKTVMEGLGILVAALVECW